MGVVVEREEREVEVSGSRKVMLLALLFLVVEEAEGVVGVDGVVVAGAIVGVEDVDAIPAAAAGDDAPLTLLA